MISFCSPRNESSLNTKRGRESLASSIRRGSRSASGVSSERLAEFVQRFFVRLLNLVDHGMKRVGFHTLRAKDGSGLACVRAVNRLHAEKFGNDCRDGGLASTSVSTQKEPLFAAGLLCTT